MTIARERCAAGMCSDVDVPGIFEWRIAGGCDVIRIDDGEREVGTVAMIACAMTPVDKAMQLKGIQKDHGDVCCLRLCGQMLAIAFAERIGDIGTRTMGNELQLFKGGVPGKHLTQPGTELFGGCSRTQSSNSSPNRADHNGSSSYRSPNSAAVESIEF